MIPDPILGILLIKRALRKKKYKKINAQFHKYIDNEYLKNSEKINRVALFFPDIPKKESDLDEVSFEFFMFISTAVINGVIDSIIAKINAIIILFFISFHLLNINWYIIKMII